jgi:hypothetical protein
MVKIDIVIEGDQYEATRMAIALANDLRSLDGVDAVFIDVHPAHGEDEVVEPAMMTGDGVVVHQWIHTAEQIGAITVGQEVPESMYDESDGR